jgi:uncharacterized protein (DUF1697 family)
MAKHVAFLRAINVGGHIVKMDALRRHCEACGLSGVETFIASGNVIFDSRAAAAALETTLEKQLHATLGYEVATFVRSLPELQAVVKTAASKRKGMRNIYVGFMKAPATAETQKAVQALGGKDERFAFSGREIYWMSDANMLESKFTYKALERITKSPATFRNITTVTKLAEKYGTETP